MNSYLNILRLIQLLCGFYKKNATGPIKSRKTPEFVCGTEILETGEFGTVVKGKFGGKFVAVVTRAKLPVKEEKSMRE